LDLEAGREGRVGGRLDLGLEILSGSGYNLRKLSRQQFPAVAARWGPKGRKPRHLQILCTALDARTQLTTELAAQRISILCPKMIPLTLDQRTSTHAKALHTWLRHKLIITSTQRTSLG
jgi:hypothetical protein